MASSRRRSKGPNGSDALCALLRSAQGGHEDALGELLAAVVPRVMIAVRTSLPVLDRRVHDPEDVASHVAVSLFRSLGKLQFRSDGELLTWLRRVTINRLHDLVDHSHAHPRDGRRTQSLDELLDGEDLPPRALRTRASDVVHLAAHNELLARIERILSEIPSEQADAVRCVDFESMDFAEAGRLLGTSRNTVRRRYAQGKAHLAEELGDWRRFA